MQTPANMVSTTTLVYVKILRSIFIWVFFITYMIKIFKTLKSSVSYDGCKSKIFLLTLTTLTCKEAFFL